MNEKEQFARRLRDAMVARRPRSPAQRAGKHFNARYWGLSVSYQAAQRWLIGLSIPEQDKLQVLVEWLNIPPHTLRYGVRLKPVLAALGSPGPRLPSPAWPPRPAEESDRATIERFLTLAADDRRLVGELVVALARSGGKNGTKPRRRPDNM